MAMRTQKKKAELDVFTACVFAASSSLVITSLAIALYEIAQLTGVK